MGLGFVSWISFFLRWFVCGFRSGSLFGQETGPHAHAVGNDVTLSRNATDPGLPNGLARTFACVFLMFVALLPTSSSAQTEGPHLSIGGVQLTISKSVLSGHRPISPTKEFLETDQSVAFALENKGSQWRHTDIEVFAVDVDGIIPNSKYWSGWAQVPAGQRNSVLLKGPDGGLLPGKYRLVLRAGGTTSTNFTVASRFARAEELTDSDEASLGPNLALKMLGARITASSEHDRLWSVERLIDGYSHIVAGANGTECSNCGWSTKEGDREKTITVELPTERISDLSSIVFDTRLFVRSGRSPQQVSAWLPKNVAISVSSTGQRDSYQQVATARLSREFSRQLVPLPEGTKGKFVKIQVVESFGWPGGTAFAEIEIYGPDEAAVSAIEEVDIDLAHPALGGSLVTYTSFFDKWPASLLFDGDPATSWVSYDTYFPQDFTVAFKDNRLAEIERVQLRLDSGPGSISWPSEIAIAASETSPLDGFVEVGRYTVKKQAGLQTFPVNQKARFIKIRVLDNYGAEKTTISEINVVEAKQPGQRSILLSSADSEETVFEGLDTDNTGSTAVTESEPNDDLATANALEPGEVVEGTIDPLGELDYFALPEFGDDASALTLGYDGYPNIRHSLELLDSQGTVLSAFDPGDLPARNASLTFELLGQERFLRLSEPPSSVVVIWDTSGSMQGSEKDLERAVREYIRLAPENQSIQVIRFSDNVETVTSGFLTNKSQLLSSLKGKFPSQGGTSLYDAIARGLSNLNSRDGNRAIVVMTDGEDNGQLWHNELWQKIAGNRIRLYTIGLGSGLERYSRKYASTGERILGHLALGTNGDSFFASESSALREFYARIANELASPAVYNLTPTIEKGQGSIRLIALGEQVPAAAMPPVHVILDVSGSMSSKLGDGRLRMAAAKAAMLGLVNSLPEGMPFGLTVYGARIPESRGKALACTDIVTVQETAPLRHQPVNAFVNEVNPRGGTTPLWATIEHVLQKMKGEPDGIVVVITDGIEECNVDMIDKLLTLGIEESKLNTLGLELKGPAALEIEDKIRTLGLQKTQLNVLGFDLRDQAAKGMMDKLAGIGSGKFYDVANGAALEEALKDAVAAPYKVLDATGRVVATGKIGGPAQPVPAGNYTVEIATSTGANRTLDVRIDKDLTTTLTVNKVGNEMDVAVGSPTKIDPRYECGLPATKRSEGGERVRRVQQKLTNLKFDPNGVDGQVGKGTRAAISAFVEAHQLDLPIEVSLVLEQHLDCVIAEGHRFEGAPFKQKVAN